MANGDAPEIARIAGSIAGTIVSLAFIPPRNKTEFACRASASAIVGYVFGVYAIPYLQTIRELPTSDATLAATCFVAFAAWWILGYVLKIIRMRVRNVAETAE